MRVFAKFVLPRRTIAAFVILAHAALLLPMVLHSKPVKRERTLQARVFDDLEFVRRGQGEGWQQCKRTYEGFGFRYAYVAAGYLVTEVAPGYPADRAGMIRGDVLEQVHLEGADVVYVAHRAGSVIRLPMRRETICQG